jgi:hypothetical protein
MSCSRKVFGLDDSERTLCSLDTYFGGFNSLINGFVSTPNTWVNGKITDSVKTGLWQKKKLQIHFLHGRGFEKELTIVLKRTTLIVLVIMIALLGS